MLQVSMGVLLSLIFWSFFEGILGIEILFCRMVGKNGRNGAVG
jgi:hypothetical protein